MTVDVSVIMPAYQAGDTIGRAVASVFAQKGVTAELVLCADDELDYGSLLPAGLRLTLCRTPAPKSGPSAARNIALATRAPISSPASMPTTPMALSAWRACCRWSSATAWRPGRRARSMRSRRPSAWPDRAAPATGCRSRTSASCACRSRRSFRRSVCPLGFPQIVFAEDVILNVDLYCAAGTYPFVDGAEYLYYASRSSRTQSKTALREARAGYLQILDLVDKRPWPEPVRDLVRRVFNEDLAAVERALALGRDGSTWRERRTRATTRLRLRSGAEPAECPTSQPAEVRQARPLGRRRYYPRGRLLPCCHIT